MWLYVYFPHLLLESSYQHLIKEQPLVVLNQQQNRIIDLNIIAQEVGVDVDMNLQTAMCLSRDLVVINDDPIQQGYTLDMLTNKARRFSSWVSQDELDGLYLEIASMEKLLGNGEAIAEQLRHQFQPLSCFIASAPYAKAARFLARSELNQHTNSQTLSGEIRKLPLERVALPLDIQYHCKRLGLETMGELLRLKPADIAYRIDLSLAHELDELTGKKRWLPNPTESRPLFSQKMELPCDVETAPQLLFPISTLLQHFCQFLKSHNLRSNKVKIRCDLRDADASLLQLTLARPSQHPDEWLYILRHELNRFQPNAPICGLHMLSKWFVTMEQSNHSLFTHENQHEQTDSQGAISALINRLDSRLGSDSYYFLSPVSDPWPETQSEKTAMAPDTTISHQAHESSAELPLFLLESAKPIKRQHYQLLHGPERIDGGWWQCPPCQRDYYIAQTHSGALHWLYKNAEQQWFLHGYFS